MKFQIIVETTDKKKATMADDDFEKLVRRSMSLTGFKFVGARSLDGIRAEVWDWSKIEEKKMVKQLLKPDLKMVGKKKPVKPITRRYRDPLE